MMPVLAVNDLNVSYGRTFAVRSVSLEISSGEVLAVVGESGSGKSTLALSLMGLLEGAKTSGSAILNRAGQGLDLLAAPERTLRGIRGREVSMIFQEPMSSLNPIMRVGAQLAEAMTLHGRMPANEIRQRALTLLGETGIADPDRCLRAYPHQLSGGQCQRVGIAMALANRPSLIIADEPTTALDVTVQAQILTCLDSLRRAHGIAILFITHDLAVVRRFADRVMVMYAGEVVESGPVAEVFARPRMPYTAALLASRPRFDAVGKPIPLDPIRGVWAGAGAVAQGCSFQPRCRHGQPALCDAAHPGLESAQPGHLVRCVRWKQVA